MNTDFQRVKVGDLFCVRVKRTSPSIWQRRRHGAQLLFRVPREFSDSFVTIQEWELDPKTSAQTVRIDFLNRIQLPATCPYESPAYWSRLRAATLGGLGQISREIQQYHEVSQILSPTLARDILNELGFFTARPVDPIREAFRPLTNHLGDQPRVHVAELMDTVEEIPYAELTADTCVMLQHLRHQRYIRHRFGREIGKFDKKLLHLAMV